jgi:hypothetical protein
MRISTSFYTLVILGLLSSLGSVVQAQSYLNDSLYIKKNGFGYTYYKGTRDLRASDVQLELRSNLTAYRQFDKALNYRTLSMITGFGGGFATGWQIGTLIRGKQPSLVGLGVGVGLIFTSFGLEQRYWEEAKKALRIFNAGPPQGNNRSFNPEFEWVLAPTAVGVQLRF